MTTRPELVDTHGATHRHGCTQPGWIGGAPLVAGVTIARCADCGTVRIITPRKDTK